MADLELDETEQMVRDAARRFLEQVTLDDLLGMEASDVGYDTFLWARMVDLGWLSLTLPAPDEERPNLVVAGVLLEELGRAGLPSPLFQTLVTIFLLGRLGGGRGLSLGEELAADALRAATVWSTEPASCATAKKTDDGVIRLNTATPILVEWAQLADVFVVPALLDSGAGGAVLVLVQAGAEGVSVLPALSFDNERMASVSFDSVLVGAEGILADSLQVEVLLDVSAVRDALRCSEMVGGARRALELAVRYVTDREQFGQPLGSMQAVQHRCADMLIHVDGAWLVTFEALWLATQGGAPQRALAVARYHVGRVCEGVVVDAAQLTGGMGFMIEYPLHVFFRRAKAQQLRLGSLSRQLDSLAAATLFAAGAAG